MSKTLVLSIALLLLLLPLNQLLQVAGEASFDADFRPLWGPADHIQEGDREVTLLMDNTSGAGIISRKMYKEGIFSAQIKLHDGDSSGTVSTIFMSSLGKSHNEFDFEFLGNLPGKPYVLQTNIFTHQVGGREVKIHLWFDPRVDFHTYSIFWNHHMVQFWVDGTLIRVHRNLESQGVSYPGDQAMYVYGSLWDGSSWATDGGRIKVNWSHAPFYLCFRRFSIAGADPSLSEITPEQRRQLQWVRRRYQTYSYCDSRGSLPECRQGVN